MKTYPQLETERLLLREPQVRDIPHIVHYANHPSVFEMTLNIQSPYAEKDAVFWLNEKKASYRPPRQPIS